LIGWLVGLLVVGCYEALVFLLTGSGTTRQTTKITANPLSPASKERRTTGRWLARCMV